jgi:DNA-binding response OmpR family regulator
VPQFAKGSNGMKVLMIDDDLVQLEMATVSLKFGGFSPRGVSRGAEGLELLKTERFDVLLLDHDMPEMNGLEVLLTLGQTGLLKDMPVIMVTSREHAAVIDRAFEIGASGFVTKPVNWTLIPHQIRFTVRAEQNARLGENARDAAQMHATMQTHDLGMAQEKAIAELRSIVELSQKMSGDSAGSQAMKSAASEIQTGAERVQLLINRMAVRR